jgi:hypothetical protein
MARGVDLGNDLHVVLLAQGDQAAYLFLGVVAPGVGLGMGVALHLQLQEELVELVVRHLADQVLQPGHGDVDVAGADTDAPLLVARYVDRAAGGDAVALGEELEDGTGAVEGAGLGRRGHRQRLAGPEFVALGSQGTPGGLDVDDDVTGPGTAAHHGNRAVSGRAEVAGEGGGDPSFGRAVGHEAGGVPVGVTAGCRGPVGQGGHRDRRALLLLCERRRRRREEQHQRRQDTGRPQASPHEALPFIGCLIIGRAPQAVNGPRSERS